jgi:hypothetical protein
MFGRKALRQQMSLSERPWGMKWYNIKNENKCVGYVRLSQDRIAWRVASEYSDKLQGRADREILNKFPDRLKIYIYLNGNSHISVSRLLLQTLPELSTYQRNRQTGKMKHGTLYDPL